MNSRQLVCGAVVGLFACSRPPDHTAELLRLQRENSRLQLEAERCRDAHHDAGVVVVPHVIDASVVISDASPRRVAAVPIADAAAPPVVAIRAIVGRNIINESTVNVRVRNVTRRVIDASRIQFELFDNFNRPVLDDIEGADNLFLGNSDQRIAPGAEITLGLWTLHRNPGTTKAIATVVEVHFVDGETWAGASRQDYDPRDPNADAGRAYVSRQCRDISNGQRFRIPVSQRCTTWAGVEIGMSFERPTLGASE